ncbi:MAG: GIY-YIG nuclease family protein [Proteobacteria bacterium]|nr:GIY-YIG nuclease family protein [Pseudomonadota bacterium]
MAFFAYIIKGLKDGSYCTVSTQNLPARLERHNQGRLRYTKHKIPWELVYLQEYHDRSIAMRKEKEIKNRKSRQFIESLVRTSRQQ